MNNLFGGIEAGGSKFVCIIANKEGRILQEKTIQTSLPVKTLQDVCNFFTIDASFFLPKIVRIGIGCFGPLNLNQLSPTYGNITSTPKPGWSNFPVKNFLQKKLDIPLAIDTDVNAAAQGEVYWGFGKKVNNLVYLTIGTGIGGGAYINKTLVHGLIHPEMGHMYIPHDGERDPFPGVCPFHGDCFEGLASGPALAKRWGKPAEQLIQNLPAWDIEAHYIALALTNIICILSPQKIVLGGGVMQQPQLINLIRQKVKKYLNGYIKSAMLAKKIDQLIVLPSLGNRSGALGAVALAINSMEK